MKYRIPDILLRTAIFEEALKKKKVNLRGTLKYLALKHSQMYAQ